MGDYNIRTRHVGEARNARIPNVSCWLINIGTHRRPKSPREFGLYQASLDEAIRRLTTSRAKMNQCFFAVTGRRGRLNYMKDKEFRTPHWLEIVDMDSLFVIEIGANQGRIDAHIILTVKHRSKLQFDHNRFQELLDEELFQENDNFIANGIVSDGDAGRPLQWAEPNLYVSFRNVGHTSIMDAVNYIAKGLTTSDHRPIEHGDGVAYVTLAQQLTDNMPEDMIPAAPRMIGRGRATPTPPPPPPPPPQPPKPAPAGPDILNAPFQPLGPLAPGPISARRRERQTTTRGRVRGSGGLARAAGGRRGRR